MDVRAMNHLMQVAQTVIHHMEASAHLIRVHTALLLLMNVRAMNHLMEVAPLNQNLATRHHLVTSHHLATSQHLAMSHHQETSVIMFRPHATNHLLHAHLITQILALNHQCHAHHTTQHHAQRVRASAMKEHHPTHATHHPTHAHHHHPTHAHHQRTMAVITKNLPADLRLSLRLRKSGLKPT